MLPPGPAFGGPLPCGLEVLCEGRPACGQGVVVEAELGGEDAAAPLERSVLLVVRPGLGALLGKELAEEELEFLCDEARRRDRVDPDRAR